MKISNLIVGLMVGTSALSVASFAHAQGATPQAAPEQVPTAYQVDDIIVTAQRRDESLSKTPVAVSVVSADTLAKAQIVSEQDLRTATPGLTIRAGLGSNQLNYSLRGQSQDAFSNSRPGVLPYINEVQIGGPGGASAFYDLQSVQVLKGPQGTLFGRSATGGAVLFTTAKPTDELGGYVSGLVGNYSAYKLEGALNLPLAGDRLMLRIAGIRQERNGFQHNLFYDSREGDVKRTGGRASLTAVMGAVTNNLVVDYLQSGGSNTVGVISGLLPVQAGFAPPPYVPAALLYGGTAPAARATAIGLLQAFTGAPTPAVTAFYDAYFSDPKHPAGGMSGELAAQQARGPYVVNVDGNNFYRAKNTIVTNTTSVDLGSSVTLKNVFGYTHLKSIAAFDEGLPFGLSGNNVRGQPGGISNLTEQLSEEIQLLGTGLNDRLDYVAGFYFSDEKYTQSQDARYFDIFFGGSAQNNSFRITNRTYAGYAQGTYRLNDSGLSVMAGARYTREKVGKILLPNDTGRINLGEPAPAGFSYDQTATYNRVSWMIGVQDQISPELMTYVVSRRAYKSGGFNGALQPKVGFSDIAGDSYRAERVTDMELGVKFQGRVSSMPVRATLALYHNWINNGQRTAYSFAGGGPASITVNVPKGKVYGLEFETQVQPTDWLSVGGTANYTKATFGSAPVNANGNIQVFDQVPDTPKFSGSIFADITVPLFGSVSGLLHGDVYRQSKSFTSPRSTNNFGTVLKGYTIANFRAGLEDETAGWSLTGNLKNAFNKVYYAGALPTGEIYQVNTLVPAEPRTFTLEARLKF